MQDSKVILRLLPSRAPDTFMDRGISKYSRMEIGLAFAKVPNVTHDLMMWLELEDVSAWRPLLKAVIAHVKIIAKRERWPLEKRGKKKLKLLVITALLDWSGKAICVNCNGSGVADVLEICELCSGKGRVTFNSKQKALMCGVRRSNWSRDGERYYSVIIDMLNQWWREAIKIIDEQLNDNYG